VIGDNSREGGRSKNQKKNQGNKNQINISKIGLNKSKKVE
jgi:hypothetical protein